MFATWKLEHTPYDSDLGTYGTKYTMDDYFRPILNMKIGDGRDSFKLEVVNPNGIYDTTFNPNDRMVISRKVNSTDLVSSDILMNGALRDVPEEVSSSKSNVKMDGYNYSETVMGAIIPVLTATNLNPVDAIKEGLRWAGLHNLNFKVTWYGLSGSVSATSASGSVTTVTSSSHELTDGNNVEITGTTDYNGLWSISNVTKDTFDIDTSYTSSQTGSWSFGDNSSTKEDGSAFPNIGKVFYYKTLKQILEECSANEFTKDGEYYWFVNESNGLVFNKRIDNVANTFNDSTDNFKRLKVKKDIKDVKNYIIMKGGSDAKGSPISFLSPDYVSISKHGFKFLLYTSSTVVASHLTDVDAKSSTIDGSSVDDIKQFFEDGGSYTVPWLISGSANTYTTFDDYNNGLRAHIKQELDKEGDGILLTKSHGTLAVEIDRSPLSGLWDLGSVIACTIGNLGGTVKNMRVEEVQYTSVMDTYILKEDKGTI